MDRRQKKTKNAILHAFEQLISVKRYEDITVQEIIDLADVGRTTFYTHYETKESLLDALCAELFAHIFDTHPTKENTHNFAHTEPSQNAMLTHILYHLREDKSRYSRLFSGESRDIFWNRFSLLFRQELDKQSQTGWWQTNTGLPDDLYLRLYAGGFIETVKWWFDHDCAESPETVEKYFAEFCIRRK